MKRRTALLALCASNWPLAALARDSGGPTATADDAFAALLRAGGCAFMIRHAQTVAGIGDPADFTIGQCSTQRNLSSDGQAQSRRLGEWFKARGLQPRQVLSSQWCRCQDTARLAFGRYTDLPALNSTFTAGKRQAAQTAQLKQRLRSIPAGQFEVWVTHQVNMTDMAQSWPQTGEAFVLDSGARLLGRRAF